MWVEGEAVARGRADGGMQVRGEGGGLEGDEEEGVTGEALGRREEEAESGVRERRMGEALRSSLSRPPCSSERAAVSQGVSSVPAPPRT